MHPRSALLAFVLAATSVAQDPGPPPRELRFDGNGYPLPSGAVARLGIPPALASFTKSVAWTADGSRYVAAEGNRITVFDAASGRCIKQFSAAADSQGATSQLLRDGRSVLQLNGSSGTLVDTASGETILSFRMPSPLGDPGRRFYSLNLSADHRFLAGITSLSSGPGVAWRYDLARNRYTRLINDRANLQSVLLSPDGKRAYATGGIAEPELTAREIATGKELWTVVLKGAGVVQAVSADGSRVAVTDVSGLTVFDAASGRQVMTVSIESNTPPGLLGIDIAPNGDRVALADGETVFLWNVSSGKVAHRLTHPSVRVAAFSPDGKSLLTASAWLQKWDLQSGKGAFPPQLLEKPYGATMLAWSGDGQRVLATWIGERIVDAGQRQVDLLTVWDVGKTLAIWKLQPDERVKAVSIDRDGATVRAYLDKNLLRTWNADHPDKQSVAHVLTPGIEGQNSAHSFQPEGRFAAQWLEPNGMRLDLYDSNGRCELRRLRSWPPMTYDRNAVRTHRIHGTTAYGPGGWRFDLAENHELPPLAGSSTFRIMDFVTTDSSAVIAGRAIDQTSIEEHIWESCTGKTIADLPHEMPHMDRARISADGRFLAISADTHVILYDFKEPRTIGRLPAAGTTALAFSPDASLLATAQSDGTILIWKVPRPSKPWQSSDAGRLWTNLESVDARLAWQATWHLLDHPAYATAMLKDRVRPEPGLTDTAEQIARLDYPRYAVREQAMKELAGRGNIIEGELRATLKASKSEEQRTRIEQLLQKIDSGVPPTGALLRGLRCVWLLERIGSPEAKKLLDVLATGAPGSRLTTEAKASLQRLAATR